VDFDVWETPCKFGRESIPESSKQASATSKDDVADKNLAQLRVARPQGFGDKGGNSFGKTGIRCKQLRRVPEELFTN